MAADDNDDKTIYYVLMNEEEQYSFWPKHLDVPKGWVVKMEGNKAECGKYVNEVWTDMRPLSLRKHMEKFQKEHPQNSGE